MKWLLIIFSFLIILSCDKDNSGMDSPNLVDSDTLMDDDPIVETDNSVDLPKRPGVPPETTNNVPHVQIGIEPVTEVNDELFRRVYEIPGIENRQSSIGEWRGLWLSDEVTILKPESTINDREIGHIHTDGSLHIFLESSRSIEAADACWGIFHPFAVRELEGWEGYVMLYTPQSIEELNVTFQLIVDGFNYVTGQNLLATDFY